MDWRTHTHKPDDYYNYQHGPDMHTHGPTGHVDTIMGDAYPEPDIPCLSCGDTGVLIRHGGREERCACGKLGS